MGGGSTTITNNQANESEKRRKQTVERAKANHLSRQLQMRLQYARLKVDHGWQKQNLNEVENLYFRHSHQRGPKPYPTPLIATTQRDPPFPSTNASSPNQSSLSFKLGPSSLSCSHTSMEFTSGQDERPAGDGLHASASNPSFAPLPPPPEGSSSTSGSVYMGVPINPADNRSLFAMDVEQEQKRSPTPSTLPQAMTPPIITSPPPDLPTARSNSISHTQSPRTSSSPVPTWGTGPGPSTTSKHYSNITQRQSQTHSLPSPPMDTYGFSASNLTYDSFWSTHSTSTVARTFRNSTGNAPAEISGGNSPHVGETPSVKGGEINGQDGSVVRTARGGGRRKNGGSRSTAGREG